MIVIDVETLPLAASLDAPYVEADNPPPTNYSKPEAIANWHAKGRDAHAASIAKRASLNPRLGRILSFAYSFGDATKSLYALTETDEAALLTNVWELLIDPQALPIVTWNGAFDLRWLIVRSIANNVTPTVGTAQWFKRYSFHPHCDVKAFLLNEWGNRDKDEGMSAWATFAGLQGKGDLDGSKVYQAYLDGKHDEIQQYNRNDVDTTLALYQRILPYL